MSNESKISDEQKIEAFKLVSDDSETKSDHPNCESDDERFELESHEMVPAMPAPTMDRDALAEAVRGFRSGFIKQGSNHIIVGLLLCVIPFITYARVASMQIPGVAGVWRMFLQVNIWVMSPMMGLLIIALGIFALLGGLAYNRRAEMVARKNAGNVAKVELSWRNPNKRNQNPALLTAKVTYADDRTEKLNLIAPKDLDVSTLIDIETAATVYGDPLSHPRPRTVVTKLGVLMEQPSEIGLWKALIAPFDNSIDDSDPVAKRIYAVAGHAVGYTLLFALVVAMQTTTSQSWFIYAVFGAGFFTIAATVAETLFLAKKVQETKSVPCSVVMTKPGFGLGRNRHSVKAKVLAAGNTEPEEQVLEAHGVTPQTYGQPLEGQVCKDKNGKILTINGPNFCLWNSKLTGLTLLPLVVYLACLPIMISSIKSHHPKKTDVAILSSAKDYYKQGVEYKAYGWTEKARAALNQAIVMDPDGKVGSEAARYLHTKIPAFPVSEEAEKENILGYNYMYRNPKEAMKIWGQCIEKYPNFEWPYGNLGSLYVEQGKPELAVPLLQKALTINPHYTNGIRHMVNAQIALGNRAEAKRYLDEVIRSDPDEFMFKVQRFALETSI